MDPVRDLEIISNELRLKDIQYMEKQIVSLKRYRLGLGLGLGKFMAISGLFQFNQTKEKQREDGRGGGREDVKTTS